MDQKYLYTIYKILIYFTKIILPLHSYISVHFPLLFFFTFVESLHNLDEATTVTVCEQAKLPVLLSTFVLSVPKFSAKKKLGLTKLFGYLTAQLYVILHQMQHCVTSFLMSKYIEITKLTTKESLVVLNPSEPPWLRGPCAKFPVSF